MPGDPLFPATRPRLVRQMVVGEGHMLYIEECAAVDGLPLLFLHGGPGSGCSPSQRRLFDPARYRAILVDPRGSGRSRPLGNTRANTTAHLVADLEYLREALGIARWLVFGSSWGSLLALAYAQAYPERVRGLVLRGIFLGSRQEIATYARDAASTADLPGGFPEEDALGPWLAAIMNNNPQQALAAISAWLRADRAARCQTDRQGSPANALPGQRLLPAARPVADRRRTNSPPAGSHRPWPGRPDLPAKDRRKLASRLAGSQLVAGRRCRPQRLVATDCPRLH
jgi:pimeloyl-ACP methyl ester carboxylesterase